MDPKSANALADTGATKKGIPAAELADYRPERRTSLTERISRSADSSFPLILASPPLNSQYSTTDSYAARTAGAFPSTSLVTDKSSMKSQPPGLTSRTMRSRAR